MVDLLNAYNIIFALRPLFFLLIEKNRFLPAIARKFSLKPEISIFNLYNQIVCLNGGF